MKHVATARATLFFLSLLPAIYVFIAIQYSAITVPFWDHTELIRWIVAWHDGTFKFASLWAPHNHTRPLVYRAVMLFNALLTDWDIRSEYVYMYAAIFGTLICHFFALRKLCNARDTLIFPVMLLLVSLLIFSPAGHNNHWWSMMFQLNMANLLIAFGMLAVFLYPGRWICHVLSALSCWLAAFTLTNGLFAFIAIIATLQMAKQKPLYPDHYTLFWMLNFALLIFLYMPGMHPEAGIGKPGIGAVLWFSVVYIGAPLGSIIWFPFKGQFDIPTSTIFNGSCGIFLLLSSMIFIGNAKERLVNKHPAALILVGFTLFAIGSAIVTGWGRAAFDAYGVANANASRYTIFGLYLLLGQIYYVAAGCAEGWLLATKERSLNNQPLKFILASAIAIFAATSSISYFRAIPLYIEVHNFNDMLSDAYPWGLEPTEFDKNIHPNPDSVSKLKYELQRLKIGPYSARPLYAETPQIGGYDHPFPLFGNRQLAQRFVASKSGLKAISITMVTWGNIQQNYKVDWELRDLSSTRSLPVAQGQFNSISASDWQAQRLQLPYLADSRGHHYEILFAAHEKLDGQNVVGLSLYKIQAQQKVLEPITSIGTPESNDLCLGIKLEYAQ